MTSRSLQFAGLIALLGLLLSASMPRFATATTGVSTMPMQHIRPLPTSTRATAAALALSQPAASACALPEASGAISGKVTAAETGENLEFVRVSAYDLNDNRVAVASTNVSGTYTLDGLFGGNYRIKFEPTNTNAAYKSEFYSNKADLGSATIVTVDDKSTTGGINAELERGGAISGTVTAGDTNTAVDRVAVTVYDVNKTIVTTASPSASGTYRVEGLAAGDYKVEFRPILIPYLAEFYNDKRDFASAELVTVHGRDTTSGIDAVLERGGAITGTVTGSGGAKLAGIIVLATEVNALDFSFAFTNGDGEFSLDGLRSGSYMLQFVPALANFAYMSEYYDDRPDKASATRIPVAASQTVSGINATLMRGSQISGKVSTSGDGGALSGVGVRIYGQQGQLVTTTFTDSSGNYSTVGLPGGDYRLEFNPASVLSGGSTPYLAEYYNDKVTLASANVITVAAPANRTGVDVALERGAQITGTVSAAGMSMGLANVVVAIYDSNGDFVTGTNTDSEGDYRTPGLRSGSYKLKFTPSPLGSSRGYAFEYYDNQPSLKLSTTVTVTAPEILSDIDTELELGACIAGLVTAADGGKVLAGVVVIVSDSSGSEIGATATNAQGKYAIEGLPGGDYKVEFRPLFSSISGDHVGEWYNDRLSEALADVVTLTAPAGRTDINAVLEPGGRITGKVTRPDGAPLDQVSVTIYDTSAISVTSISTNATGVYTSTVLRNGDYTVRFQAPGSSRYDAPEYYNNKPDRTSADVVAVAAPRLSSGIDAVLEMSGAISGRVTTAADGAGVAGVAVRVYAASGEPVASAFTNATGVYKVTGLLGADYRVGFVPDRASSLQATYYNGKPDLASATTLTVTSGAETANINAVLSRQGLKAFLPSILR